MALLVQVDYPIFVSDSLSYNCIVHRNRLFCFFFFSEYKKAKLDIKKAASDTIRLQKKVKKGASHGKIILVL